MKTVSIIRNSKGEYFTKFENSTTDYGFLKVKGVILVFTGSQGRPKTVFAQIKCNKDFADLLLATGTKAIDKDGNECVKLPGQILVREYLESEIPASVIREFISPAVIADPEEYEKVIAQYKKRLVRGEDIIPFTLDGEQIYEFNCFVDSQEPVQHRLQHHDNGAELHTFVETAKAELPQNDDTQANDTDAGTVTTSIRKNANKAIIKTK